MRVTASQELLTMNSDIFQEQLKKTPVHSGNSGLTDRPAYVPLSTLQTGTLVAVKRGSVPHPTQPDVP